MQKISGLQERASRCSSIHYFRVRYFLNIIVKTVCLKIPPRAILAHYWQNPLKNDFRKLFRQAYPQQEKCDGAIGNMSLILVNKSDITVGEPSPCALYDQERNLLLEEGEVVRDKAHLNSLLDRGAYRDLSWGVSDNENGDDSDDAETSPGQTEVEETSTPFTFNDMKLKVEDRLQLQPPEQLTRERFPVKVIGFIRNVSLLVTTPVIAGGLRLQLLEGERVIMRSFLGQNAFGFACTIERICKTPCEYLHLSFPDVIQGIVIRKAPRVKTRIIATAHNSNPGGKNEPVSALISNISANGMALDAKQPLGNKGDIISLTFRVNLHKIDALLSIKGLICAVLTGDAANPSNPDLIRHGIEFRDLQPNDSVILQSMIYQNIIENPHKLM